MYKFSWLKPVITNKDYISTINVQLYGKETPQEVGKLVGQTAAASLHKKIAVTINGFGAGGRPENDKDDNRPALLWAEGDLGPWYQNGILKCNQWWMDFLIGYVKHAPLKYGKSRPIDLVIADTEENNWIIPEHTQKEYGYDDIWKKLIVDPRFNTLPIYENMTLAQSWELAKRPSPLDSPYYPANFCQWYFSECMTARNWAMKRSLYDLTKLVFPKCLCGNYGDYEGQDIRDTWQSGAKWLNTKTRSWADIQWIYAYPVHKDHEGNTHEEKAIAWFINTLNKVEGPIKGVFLPLVGVPFDVGGETYIVTQDLVYNLYQICLKMGVEYIDIWFSPKYNTVENWNATIKATR